MIPIFVCPLSNVCINVLFCFPHYFTMFWNNGTVELVYKMFIFKEWCQHDTELKCRCMYLNYMNHNYYNLCSSVSTTIGTVGGWTPLAEVTPLTFPWSRDNRWIFTGRCSYSDLRAVERSGYIRGRSLRWRERGRGWTEGPRGWCRGDPHCQGPAGDLLWTVRGWCGRTGSREERARPAEAAIKFSEFKG